ncbi:MAG: YicC family protein [Clostridiales bacterium]|nr:YicC family protein [Clostridiales bacterium]
MQSMTGYGRGRAERDGREIAVELKSVNHRFLDLSFRIPRNLGFLEETARKLLGERLARGHVDVFVNYQNRREDASVLRIDTAKAAALYEAGKELGTALSLPQSLSVSDLLRFPDVVTSAENEEDADAVRALFEEALSQALTELVAMRRVEGGNLRRDLLSKAQAIDTLRQEIAELAPQVVLQYREKLHERLTDLLQGKLDEARFTTEVAIFADRASIDEELVRLVSHLKQIRDLAEEDAPVGRRLDFLVQELNREFNTIGSKAMDAEIARRVVAGKNEIEKMREQVQNVE